jgi:hypothetical protein
MGWRKLEKKMKATYVQDMSDFSGVAKLYRVDPPVSFDDDKKADHVVVSAVDSEWACETYIFPANEKGDVLSWGELDGSQRGSVSHQEVLHAAGYQVEDGEVAK